ncbi:molybdate ABC transporter substrate-binding protein [Ramlibacter tataouinensis]|uniref:Periplasmic component of an ABC type molybdate transport system-like protein n=1 Tax=Ramlibacter tataouinensis (strain ATCC BAA-407 / DSM 14655 / LMG 21543 / TTB310) TaxID=365046 RepID=F5Y044_RAMTT|nr:substrate-binding domain-containing protein [Ramlibacter tataouinensis]AEG94593.1 periplasmic component of an ABC type molybdate transport system-like protein [Ramlibacter tataouinensis TTB310]
MAALNILSGGAAQALVGRMQPAFTAQAGMDIAGTFGAVGAMRDKLTAGEPCDVVILTEALVHELAQQGWVDGGSARPLGVVRTGVAVRSGEPHPEVARADALAAALRQASGIYLPDPLKATAGIHFMKVLRALGLDQSLAQRLRAFPNGNTAMREMAQADAAGAIGCTQVTEILFTPGVELVGLLPPEFELATVYTAAVCSRAAAADQARALVELLAGPQARAARAEVGIEAA